MTTKTMLSFESGGETRIQGDILEIKTKRTPASRESVLAGNRWLQIGPQVQPLAPVGLDFWLDATLLVVVDVSDSASEPLADSSRNIKQILHSRQRFEEATVLEDGRR